MRRDFDIRKRNWNKRNEDIRRHTLVWFESRVTIAGEWRSFFLQSNKEFFLKLNSTQLFIITKANVLLGNWVKEAVSGEQQRMLEGEV